MLDGRPSSALPLLTRALTLRPTNAAVLGLRSLARERCGLTASATSDARAIVLLQPRNSGGYVRLASVCLAANDYPSAACVAFRGMRCGDTHRNGELAAIMAKARAQGHLPPVPWTPVGWAEAAMWRLRADGKVMYCGCSSSIKAIGVDTGEQLLRLAGHKLEVTALVLHPADADVLLSSSQDGTVRQWNVKLGADGDESSRCLKVFNLESAVHYLMIAPRLASEESAAAAVYALVAPRKSQQPAQRAKPPVAADAVKGSKKRKLPPAADEAQEEAGEAQDEEQEESNKSVKKSKRKKGEAGVDGGGGEPQPEDTPDGGSSPAAAKRNGTKGKAEEQKDEGSQSVKKSKRKKGVADGGGGGEPEPVDAADGGSSPPAAKPKSGQRKAGSDVGVWKIVRVDLNRSSGRRWTAATLNKGRALQITDAVTGARHTMPAGQWPVTAVTASCSGAVATGHKDGSMTVWRGLGTAAEEAILSGAGEGGRGRAGGRPKSTTLHWHAHAVSCLAFSPDGGYLYSGGEEGVLVQWNLRRGGGGGAANQNFLPRLGAPLTRIAMSPDGLFCALTLEDNCVALVRISTWAVEWQDNCVALKRTSAGVALVLISTSAALRGLALAPTRELVDYSAKIKLGIDASSGAVVINGQPGHLQYYDPHQDLLSGVLEVVPFNRVSRVDKLRMAPPLVEHFAFSSSGERVATLDTREVQGEGLRQGDVRCLKFWALDRRSGRFLLESSVDQPHQGAVTSLCYHPLVDRAVTTSLDETFKVWTMQRRDPSLTTPSTTVQQQQQGPQYMWTCTRTVAYKRGLSAEAAAFSSDGSLLAVAFGGLVTLWGGAGASLLAVLLPPLSAVGSAAARVHALAFVPRTALLFAQRAGAATLTDVVAATTSTSTSDGDAPAPSSSSGTVWAYKGKIACACAATAAAAVMAAPGGGGATAAAAAAFCLQRSASSSLVLLMGRSSAVPLCAWHLPSDVLHSMVLIGSSGSGGGGAERGGGVVGLTRGGDVLLLSTGGSSSGEAQLDATGVRRIGGAAAAPALPLRAAAAAAPRAGAAAVVVHRSAGIEALFRDMPTSDLPPATELLGAFMRAQLRPAPAEAPPWSAAAGAAAAAAAAASARALLQQQGGGEVAWGAEDGESDEGEGENEGKGGGTAGLTGGADTVLLEMFKDYFKEEAAKEKKSKKKNKERTELSADSACSAAEVPVADPTMPIDEAKAAALALAHTKDSARLPDIVKSLEKQFSSEPIHTVDFFNLAISGEWDVVHSTLYPKRAPAAVVSSEDLTVRSLRQTITPSDGGNPREGEITTAVEWELPEQGITGTFEVVAQYLTGDNSSMKLTTTGHRLKPSSMPSDPQGLVELLQRHMPFELFDPDEQAVFTTYVDHDMRIVWAAGGRTGANGSRIIFLRHHSQ
ncbi:hypothetical protein JKP88DRAFT_353167 [Tribonema minus]|uniref:WD repeat-containing protein 75 second beta-propeller domain-containing protein n=1 Tax=Tribonema minus TaxID=303371 RepID=A0A835Z938_9STRA|nr:hypothetical protein JKP88DRAFT_353167 [Tribonema minus]